jgi:hypothetical protein
MDLSKYRIVVKALNEGATIAEAAARAGLSIPQAYRHQRTYLATLELAGVDDIEESDLEEQMLEEEEFEEDQPINSRAMLNGPEAEVTADRRSAFKSFRQLMKAATKVPDDLTEEEVNEVREALEDYLVLADHGAELENFDVVRLLNCLNKEIEDDNNVGIRILGEFGLALTSIESEDDFSEQEFANLKLASKLKGLGATLKKLNGTEVEQEQAGQLAAKVQEIREELPDDDQFDTVAIQLEELAEQLTGIATHDRGFLGLGGLPEVAVEDETIEEIETAVQALSGEEETEF